MENKNIFPDSVINQSYEQIIAEYSKRTKILYIVILFAIVAVFVSLFYIYIDVGVRATGIIKPRGERNIITAPVSGKIKFINLAENIFIRKGDTVFIVVSDAITSQIPALNRRKDEINNMILDLNNMLDAKNASNLQSPAYIRIYNHYKTQLKELQYKNDVCKTTYEREKKLFDKGITAAAEFEKYEADYKNSQLAINTFMRGQRAQWQSDKISYENELSDIETKLAQIEIQNAETVVTATVDGIIQHIENINDGSYIHAGQKLIEIAPDGNLLAECYVTSNDIGLLVKNLPVRMQVDAFNYNQWGMLDGKIVDIAEDITITNDASYYKIYCSFEQNYLQLNNGYKAYVKKGMKVNVHCIVNRRSLFQLLYDKIDDWINPAQKDIEN
ncbi:MAG: HlyD family secretion protein [Prevotellaceae bacterium]|jgi:HlyD family secretion protein|nr:HlyD family secretion protein [Prevotellaceae bacterium]